MYLTFFCNLYNNEDMGLWYKNGTLCIYKTGRATVDECCVYVLIFQRLLIKFHILLKEEAGKFRCRYVEFFVGASAILYCGQNVAVSFIKFQIIQLWMVCLRTQVKAQYCLVIFVYYLYISILNARLFLVCWWLFQESKNTSDYFQKRYKSN